MTTINELKDKIYDWVKLVSDYDDNKIFWNYQEIAKPYTDFIHLNLLNYSSYSTKNHLTDGTIENVNTIHTQLSLNIYGKNAEVTAVNLLNSLNTDTVLQLFTDDIGYEMPTETTNLSYYDADNKQPVNRYMLNIPFQFNLTAIDDVGYFDKIEVETIMKSPNDTVIFDQTNIYDLNA
jgi:hypothetical protein